MLWWLKVLGQRAGYDALLIHPRISPYLRIVLRRSYGNERHCWLSRREYYQLRNDLRTSTFCRDEKTLECKKSKKTRLFGTLSLIIAIGDPNKFYDLTAMSSILIPPILSWDMTKTNKTARIPHLNPMLASTASHTYRIYTCAERPYGLGTEMCSQGSKGRIIQPHPIRSSLDRP